jgi:hypothetical protein
MRAFTDIWKLVLRPALSDQQGFAVFISSPGGKNWFFDLYEDGKLLENWSSFQFTTADGGYVPTEEIEAARHDMDEKSFMQEYYATFESFEGLVVPHFSRDTHLVHDFELRKGEMIHLGHDLNVTINPGVFCVIRDGIITAFDEISGDLDTPAFLKSVEARYDPSSITIYPDASSGQRSTVGASKTSLKMFRDTFATVKVNSKNPKIHDRIAACNSLVKAADGTIRFRVTPNCTKLISSLEKHFYDPESGLPSKKYGHDHFFDAVSYLTWFHSPLTKRVTKIGQFSRMSYGS